MICSRTVRIQGSGFRSMPIAIRHPHFRSPGVTLSKASMKPAGLATPGSPSKRWRSGSRADPIRLRDVIKAEARTPAGRWRPIELDAARIVRTRHPNHIGYRLGREILLAVREQITTALGIPIFDYRPPTMLDMLRVAPVPELQEDAVVLEDDDLADIAFVARRKAEEAARDNNE